MQDLRIPANWTAAVASSSSLLQLTISYSSSDFEVYSCSTDSTDKLLLLSSLSFNSVPNRLSFPHHARDSPLSLSLSLQNKGSDKKSRNKQCTHNNNQGLNPTQNTLDNRKLATPAWLPCPNSISSFSPNSLKNNSKNFMITTNFSLPKPHHHAENSRCFSREIKTPQPSNDILWAKTKWANAQQQTRGRETRRETRRRGRISDQRSMLRTKR